jgi:hypothetical protein
MEEGPLSIELQELEGALASRPLSGPSALLREKVLGEVRRRATLERGRSRWRFAVAAAAGVLLWLNLSLVATHTTDCGLRQDNPGESLETACRHIEKLVPGLSPEEARRQAILLRAGSALVPCPDLARPFPLDEHREQRSN